MNRNLKGEFASKMEAQKADCVEAMAYYRARAKQALQNNDKASALVAVGYIVELRNAFKSDYGVIL